MEMERERGVEERGSEGHLIYECGKGNETKK